MNNTDATHTVIIKTPYKFIWSFFAVTVLFGQTYSMWWGNFLSDMLYWLTGVIVMFLHICIICLFLKYYRKTYAKQLVFDTCGTTMVTYQLVRWLGIRSYDSKQLILKVKGDKIRLLKNNKTVVKVYKSTLADPKDWDWIIDHYTNRS